MMEYQWKDERLTWDREVDTTHTIGMEAESIRQEKTGIHARLSITCNQRVLSWGVINIERDEDRVRFANSAYKHIATNGLKDAYPNDHLKHELDLFCRGLWPEVVRALLPERVKGAAVRTLPSFRVEPYILSGGGTILFAPPGRGKSYLLMLLAVSVDAGVDQLFPVQQGNILFVNLERSKDTVVSRLGNVNEALGLPRTRELSIINARGRSLHDVLPGVRQAVREQRVSCVFLDSISRAGFGDLTENRPVNAIADALNSLGVEWFGIAHTPRGDESHVYGSVHFEAAADVMLQAATEQQADGTLGIGLKVTKQNDFGKRPMQRLALEFNAYGLTTARKATMGEFPDLERKGMSLKEQIADYLMDVGSATATDIAEAIDSDRANTSRLLNHDDGFVRVKKVGKNQFFGVRMAE